MILQKRHRFWRKNRQPNANSKCDGTDLNRNWGFKWAGIRSSANPCSNVYHGSSPYSAPETKALSEYVQANQRNIFSFIDIHSYSQLWMYPWSYTKDDIKDRHELNRVSVLSVQELKRKYNTDFKPGPASIIIYESSGNIKDWSYGQMGIKYTFTLELRDTGKQGFLLPREQIVPSGEETLAALKILSKSVKDYGQKSSSYYQANNKLNRIKNPRRYPKEENIKDQMEASYERQ